MIGDVDLDIIQIDWSKDDFSLIIFQEFNISILREVIDHSHFFNIIL